MSQQVLKQAVSKCGVIVAVSSALLFGGCVQAPKQMYVWGGYQAQVYEHFKGDGKSPLEQLQVLEMQLQTTSANRAAIPPGLHAHVGLLKLKVGQADEGIRHLETEKVLFPESATYIDSLLKRARSSRP